MHVVLTHLIQWHHGQTTSYRGVTSRAAQALSRKRAVPPASFACISPQNALHTLEDMKNPPAGSGRQHLAERLQRNSNRQLQNRGARQAPFDKRVSFQCARPLFTVQIFVCLV